tara:strand:- start:34 stop:339 length:306 start_codon:yes stop_codon:yes gene_type:complete
MSNEALEKEGTENTIFVGNKPLMNYVKSVAIQFKNPKNSHVIIKSRGKFISKAVDVAEISRKKYLDQLGIKLKGVDINSQDLEKEGRKTTVSTMSITLSKK